MVGCMWGKSHTFGVVVSSRQVRQAEGLDKVVNGAQNLVERSQQALEIFRMKTGVNKVPGGFTETAFVLFLQHGKGRRDVIDPREGLWLKDWSDWRDWFSGTMQLGFFNGLNVFKNWILPHFDSLYFCWKFFLFTPRTSEQFQKPKEGHALNRIRDPYWLPRHWRRNDRVIIWFVLICWSWFPKVFFSWGLMTYYQVIVAYRNASCNFSSI